MQAHVFVTDISVIHMERMTRNA